jgi:hypothetical protein
MATITIGSEEGSSKKDGEPDHPDHDGELEMTKVVRVDGASGMFWVASDYSDETPAMNKAGVVLDPLKLR